MGTRKHACGKARTLAIWQNQASTTQRRNTDGSTSTSLGRESFADCGHVRGWSLRVAPLVGWQGDRRNRGGLRARLEGCYAHDGHHSPLVHRLYDQCWLRFLCVAPQQVGAGHQGSHFEDAWCDERPLDCVKHACVYFACVLTNKSVRNESCPRVCIFFAVIDRRCERDDLHVDHSHSARLPHVEKPENRERAQSRRHDQKALP